MGFLAFIDSNALKKSQKRCRATMIQGRTAGILDDPPRKEDKEETVPTMDQYLDRAMCITSAVKDCLACRKKTWNPNRKGSKITFRR